MRNAAFHRPVLHGVCHDVGHLRVKGRTISDGFVQRLVNILGQTLLHDGVIENAAAEKLFDVGHPGFLLQSHFALESVPAAGESGSAFRRAPRKTRFFAFTKKRATARTNEIHLTAPLLLKTSIAAWKGFVKGFFALILFFPFKNDRKNENAEHSQKATNAPDAEKYGR